ncbi:MAG: hypothetical protein HOM21_06245 [Halobacteriovoraceae bacterium]|jgi:hypothetical protein|nr:hypothetical protein [Halobacteriovoraceae bacterium]
MTELLLGLLANYLIEFMSFLLVTALVLRYFSYKQSKKDEGYFSQFTRELNSTIDEDKTKGVEFEEVEGYLTNLLGRVNQKLPHRNLREDTGDRSQSVSLGDYVGSKHGMIASIQNESSVFNCRVPPDYTQLTDRVLSDDKNWTKLFGIINFDAVTRTIDMLPGLFIIFGVFGTFIGISMALPEIAKIDFANMESSGKTLADFVISVTFAMKTSIVGIFFSIILTLLNTIFPIEETRERTFEKVETSLQLLWYHIQKDQDKNSNTEMVKILNKILTSLSGESDKKKNHLKKVG